MESKSRRPSTLPPQNVQANSNIKKALANKFFLNSWDAYDEDYTPSVPLTDVIDKRIYFFTQGLGQPTGMVEARRDPDGVTIHVSAVNPTRFLNSKTFNVNSTRYQLYELQPIRNERGGKSRKSKKSRKSRKSRKSKKSRKSRKSKKSRK